MRFSMAKFPKRFAKVALDTSQLSELCSPAIGNIKWFIPPTRFSRSNIHAEMQDPSTVVIISDTVVT